MNNNLHDKYSEKLKSHRHWLASYNQQLLKLWENRLNNNIEAAICEACLRIELGKQVDEVRPGEKPDSGGLDFLCRNDRTEFYVECASVGQEKVEEKTGLPMNFESSSSFFQYSLLTNFFKNRCSEKGSQLACRPGTIRLLAIATLHFHAGCVVFDERGAEYLLTGEAKLAFRPRDLDSSFCLKREDNGCIRPVRQHFSAILLCYFGPQDSRMYGALHPYPACLFDYSLLPDIPFFRFKEDFNYLEKREVELVGPDRRIHRKTK